jgi:hypothetical protein
MSRRRANALTLELARVRAPAGSGQGASSRRVSDTDADAADETRRSASEATVAGRGGAGHSAPAGAPCGTSLPSTLTVSIGSLVVRGRDDLAARRL